MTTKRVLMVEDDTEVAQLVDLVLTARGYEVTSAESVNDALRSWEESGQSISIALVDLNLGSPGDGIPLATRFKKENPTARVVLMSGEAVQPKDAPDLVFLQKPFTTSELLRTIGGA